MRDVASALEKNERKSRKKNSFFRGNVIIIPPNSVIHNYISEHKWFVMVTSTVHSIGLFIEQSGHASILQLWCPGDMHVQ